MKHILFVDDEPNILTGLRRMLSAFDEEWRCEFASSGMEAVTMLQDKSFDVIVTDMRMPSISGVDLLRTVRDEHPGVVRVILSGQADRNAAMQSVGLAHQFLAKPCEPQKIRTTVARAAALQDRMSDERLQRIASAVRSLPSLPVTYSAVMEAVESPDTPLSRVGDIISHDVAMTAKVLQVVNSAFFGLPRRIESPAQAVTLLGLDTVRALVLSAGVFSQFDSTRLAGFSIDDLSAHSLAVGSCAKRIARTVGMEKTAIDDAFMAGVLHDVGMLVLIDSMPAQFHEAVEAARASTEPRWAFERRMLGATHAEVGGFLMGLWGLNERIVDACMLHPFPNESADESFTPLTAVHVADCIASEAMPSEFDRDANLLDMTYLNRVGAADLIDDWRRQCADLFTEAPAL